jgi:hypothetical protein
MWLVMAGSPPLPYSPRDHAPDNGDNEHETEFMGVRWRHGVMVRNGFVFPSMYPLTQASASSLSIE